MKTLVLTGCLTTQTALHIGSGRGSKTADSLLRRTASGDIFIPGSALAGALRSMAVRLAPRFETKLCWDLLDENGKKAQQPQKARPQRGIETTRACDCATCHLFGATDPQAQNTPDGGQASRLWVYDARLQAVSLPTAVRDNVGIGRATGASARVEAVKFDLEVLPDGAMFDFRIELEDPDDLDEPLLAAVLAEWRAGRARLGGRVGRGFGAVSLSGLKSRVRTLDTAAALMDFLRDTEPEPSEADADEWLAASIARLDKRRPAANDAVACSWIEIVLTLQATGPFLANDVTRANRAGFDHAPLVENGRPILPGASLRGVLRSHAERIARTLATTRVTAHGQAAADEFWLTCPACSPVARPLDARQSVPLQVCDSRLAKPSDEEVNATRDLCLACQLFGSTEWGSRLVVEDAPLVGEVADYKVQDFLAIDRFTGGGRDSAKFDAAVLWRPKFTARLRLANPHAWELGWLALALRDLAEGWLTLGFGRAKGFGQVTVTDWKVRVGRVGSDDFPVAVPSFSDEEDGGDDAAEGEPEAPSSPVPPASVTSPTPLALATLFGERYAVDEVSVYEIAELHGKAATETGDIAWQVTNADAGSWRGQVAAWVQAFNAEVNSFPRLPRRLKQSAGVDTYFGQAAEKLYPKVEGGASHGR